MKFAFRSAGPVLGAVLMAVGVSLGGGTPASAAPVDCTGSVDHYDNTDLRRWIADGQAVRSGPRADCSVRFRGPVEVDVDCWMENSLGATWWFVQSRLGQGWAYEGNFGSPPPRHAHAWCFAPD
jgi:hypothetical protein